MASSPKFVSSEGENFEVTFKSRQALAPAETSLIKVNDDGTVTVAGVATTAALASGVAFTQTYSTASATVPADTSHAITDSSGGTPSTTAIAAITGGGAGCENATKNAVATLAAELALAKADALATKKIVNKLIDALQAVGIVT